MKHNIVSLILCFFILSTSTQAQLSEGGIPTSFSSVQLKSKIDSKILKSPNVEKLKIEDEAEALQGDMPPRFGYPIEVGFTNKSSGTWETLDNGDRIWRLNLKAKNARAMSLIFNHYELPKGAKLHIYSADQKFVIGAFTHKNNKIHHRLPTQLVRGDEIVLEYYEPQKVDFEGILEIEKIIYAYRYVDRLIGVENDMEKNVGYDQSSSCNIDVNCNQGSNWSIEKNSVALIVVDGTRYCSGSLINSTNQVGTPYFITANHCLCNDVNLFNECSIFPDAESNFQLDNCIFYWNYERPCVFTGTDPFTNVPTTAGAIVLANNSINTSDFGFLTLDENPLVDSSIGAYLNGWNHNNSNPTPEVGIHHPKGDVKKISIVGTFSNSNTITYGNGITTCENNSCTNVVWLDGATEKGSSGSPLFNTNKQIIGTLNGNTDNACQGAQTAHYGNLSYSWNNGDNNTNNLNSLKYWLDPNGNSSSLNGTSTPSAGVFLHLSHDKDGDGDFISGVQENSVFTENEVIKFRYSTYGYPSIQLFEILVSFDGGTNFDSTPIGTNLTNPSGIGEYDWLIPNNQCIESTNVRFKIIPKGGGNSYTTPYSIVLNHTSNGSFVNVIQPNYQSSYLIDATGNIIAELSCIFQSNPNAFTENTAQRSSSTNSVDIDLFINGVFHSNIVTNHPVSGNTINYTWDISNNTTTATNYAQVRIRDSNAPSLESFSEIFSLLAYGDCSNAINLNVGTTCSFNEILYLDGANASSTNPSCGMPMQLGDVWTKAQVPTSGNITIQVSSAPHSGAFAVYTDCNNLGGSELGCDDDGLLEMTLTNLTPGMDLYIRSWLVSVDPNYTNPQMAVCAFDSGSSSGGSGTCNNNCVQDNGETGIDCGGSSCSPCDSQPNLAITNSNIAAGMTLDPNTGFSFDIEVSNLNNNTYSGNAQLQLFLSSDTSPDPSEQLCNDEAISLNCPYGTDYISCTVAGLTGYLGSYYLIAVADAYNTISESDETDNTYIIPINIAPANGNLPDIVIQGAGTNNGTFNPSSTVNVNISYSNQGNYENIGWQNSINSLYLNDGATDTHLTDFAMAYFQANSLPQTATVNVVLPSNISGTSHCIKIVLDANNQINEGNESNNSTCIPITINNNAPTVNFYSNQTTICEGESVFFYDASSGNPTSWSWTFTGGDISSSTAESPVVTYPTAGTYDVSLTTTNQNGTGNTVTQTGYITVLSAGSGVTYTNVLAAINSTSPSNGQDVITPNAVYPTLPKRYFPYLTNSFPVPNAHGISKFSVTSPFTGQGTITSDNPIYDTAFGWDGNNHLCFYGETGSALKSYVLNGSSSNVQFIGGATIYNGGPTQIHRLATCSSYSSSVNNTRRFVIVLHNNKIRILYDYVSPPNQSFVPIWNSDYDLSGLNSFIGGNIIVPDEDFPHFYVGRGNTLYSFSFNPDLVGAFDISLVSNKPTLNTSFTLTGNVTDMWQYGSKVFVLTDQQYLYMFDENNLITPILQSSIQLTNLVESTCGMTVNANGSTYAIIGGDGQVSNVTAVNIGSLNTPNFVEEPFDDTNCYQAFATDDIIGLQSVYDYTNGQVRYRGVNLQGDIIVFDIGTTQQVDCSSLPSTISASGTTNICAGSTVMLSAPTGYTYLWNTREMTESINVNQAGDYWCTISSCGGCSVQSNTITVSTSSGISVTPSVINETCNAGNGAINLTVSGGTPPYSYSWSDGSITQNRNNLSFGNYTVTVQDNGNCTYSNVYSITNTGSLPIANFSYSVSDQTITLDDASTNASVVSYNMGDGNTVNASNFSYTFSSGGTYDICLTATNTCGTDMDCENIVIANPCPLVLDIVTTPTTCGADNGSVTITATSGTIASVQWDSNAGNQTNTLLTGLVAGTYNVTLTEASGCSILESVVISDATVTSIVEQKVIVSDGAIDDRFGASTSMAGNKALIGAFRDNDNGSSSGSAYVFEYDGVNWIETQKIVASDGAAGDFFGYRVFILDNIAIISALYDDDNGSSSGSAYIFEYDGVSWIETQKIVASDGAAGDQFGCSIAAFNNTIVIGSYKDNSSTGSAYIFEYDGVSWVETQKITASDISAHFGFSVSISDDVLIVGAFRDDDNGSYSGSAYIFEHNGVNWVETQKIVASDGMAEDYFGYSVSISSGKAIISSLFDDDNGSYSGSAYIFEYDGLSWIETQKIAASDGAAGDQFGRSVCISENMIIIGAPFDDENQIDNGSIYIFEFNGSNWIETQKIVASDKDFEDSFGYSVSMDMNQILVGAFMDDNNGLNSGSAYFYQLPNTSGDADLDGICDNLDNCPNTYNPLQNDSDIDGIGDVCDIDCPLDYTGANTLTSNVSSGTITDYETNGVITSSQTIDINTDYDSGDCIELLPGFEVIQGTVFDAFIDGCDNGGGGNQ